MVFSCTTSPGVSSGSLLSVVQELYSAWIDQGLEWIALYGQAAAVSSQPPAGGRRTPAPQDLMLSAEQLQLVTEYFQKVQS